jgi:hypothetical protein
MFRGSTFTCVLLSALALAACDEDEPSTDEAGSAGTSNGEGGAGAGGAGELVPCLDRPDTLTRPPSGRLPCELIPPGLAP